MKWLDNLTTLEQALDIILGHLTPVTRTELVPLTQACGRVLGCDLRAILDVPPFDRAAMDGYVVTAGDTCKASASEPVTLTCCGSIFAGSIANPTLKPGNCYYIATGARLPDDADAVVRAEDSVRKGNMVEIYKTVNSKQNTAAAGEDIRKGSVVLNRGTLLTPARMGVLASQGLNQVEVYVKPTISVITTGDELAQPPIPLKPGQIYDINSSTLSALITQNRGKALVSPSAGDSISDLRQSLKQAMHADMIVVSGGSSVGERDYMFELLSAEGSVAFHGVNIKPGKPTLFAIVNGKPVLSLPGYPTSCLVIAYLLLLPALRKLARVELVETRGVEAELTADITANTRRQFIPVSLKDGYAVPVGKESGAITATAFADGFITVQENNSLNRASKVEVTLF